MFVWLLSLFVGTKYLADLFACELMNVHVAEILLTRDT